MRAWLFATLLPLTLKISKKRIGIYPPQELNKRQSTFDSVAEIVPVTFEPFSPETSSLPDACVFLGQDHPVTQRLGIPCYVWEKKPVSFTSDSTKVKFASWAWLHHAIRGQILAESDPRNISSCSVEERDTVMATVADHPVWSVRGPVHRVSIEPPHLSDNELLYSHFVPERWLGLLPFLHFLRCVSADIDWQAPPQRACVVFDDPNLHTLTYGHLDFRKIARDAKARNYHVAIATVPLDAWYVNREAARLFKEHSDYLSLAIHGSEHTWCELNGSNPNQLSRLAQGLRRIDVLEQKAEIGVSRVMLAPHGACSEQAMELMLRLGYEGLAIRPHSLLTWVHGRRWPRHFGLGNVLWMGSGFPVIYRFALGSNVAKIRLAAFLGQAIVPYGHHSDCSQGLALLGSVADTVNSMGACWADLQSIMRSNYRIRTTGNLLRLQMGSRRVKVRIPENIEGISVQRPWMVETDMERLAYTDGEFSKEMLTGPVTDPIEVKPGSEITIRALPKEEVNYQTLAARRIRIWPITRRVLVEARDRLRPIPKLVNRRRG
jgi:hypothetical protein